MKNTLQLIFQALTALALTALAIEGAVILAHLNTPSTHQAASVGQLANYYSNPSDGPISVHIESISRPLEVELKEVDNWAFNNATVPVKLEQVANNAFPTYSYVPVEVKRWDAGRLEVQGR